MLRTTFLWIHVLCGAAWVAVSLSFMLAAAAATEDEGAGFTARVAPTLNRLNLAAIVILPLSGIANLFFVARERHYRLPTAFVEVLGAKIVLLSAMAGALAIAWRTAARLGAEGSSGGGGRRLARVYGAMAALGAIALMLGLWLAGSA